MIGKLVLEITEWGKLAITVNNGSACCERTDADADMSMTAFEAGRFIFGPKAAFYAAELPVDKNVLITNWFPLPLSWWHQDCV